MDGQRSPKTEGSCETNELGGGGGGAADNVIPIVRVSPTPGDAEDRDSC